MDENLLQRCARTKLRIYDLFPHVLGYWDAGRIANLALDSSGNVTSWAESLGKGGTVTSAGAGFNPPNWVATGGMGPGSGAAVKFPTSRNCGLYLSTGLPSAPGTAFVVICLHYFEAAGAAEVVLELGTGQYRLRKQSTNVYSAVGALNGPTPPIGEPFIFADITSASSPYHTYRLNGGDTTNWANDYAAGINVTGRDVSIGVSYASSGLMFGRVSDVLILAGNPPLWVLQQAEGILCHGRNLQTLLPASHPYRNAPPYV